MKPLAACLVVALASSSALAQPDIVKALSPRQASPATPPRSVVDLAPQLDAIRSATSVPAVCAAMIDSNGLLAHGVAGVRSADGSTPVTINDKWHLGSCTKAMTGTLCALLVDSGALRWDSTFDEVLNPRRDEKSKVTNNWRLVTLRDLLTCTANVPYDLGEYGGRPMWANLWEKHRNGATPTEQREYLFNELVRNNIGPPTSSFQYANASLALAGYMAETAASTPYEQLITARLFAPLGMTSAGFGAPGTPTDDGAPQDQPWGHDKRGRPVRPGINADNPASLAPAGTAHMSIDDWARFARVHLIGARLTLPRPDGQDADHAEPGYDPTQTLGLTPADFAVLHAQGFDRNNDYACGWIVTLRPAWAKGDQPGDTGRCLTHTGSNTMWTAAIWIAPEIDRAFLAVVNSAQEGVADDARERALQAMIALDRQWRGLPPMK